MRLVLRFEPLSRSCNAISSGSRCVRSNSKRVIWNQGKLRKGLNTDGFAVADESGELLGDLKEESLEESSFSGLASNVFHAGAQEHIWRIVSIS